jgi:hypothetical protein
MHIFFFSLLVVFAIHIGTQSISAGILFALAKPQFKLSGTHVFHPRNCSVMCHVLGHS